MKYRIEIERPGRFVWRIFVCQVGGGLSGFSKRGYALNEDAAKHWGEKAAERHARKEQRRKHRFYEVSF